MRVAGFEVKPKHLELAGAFLLGFATGADRKVPDDAKFLAAIIGAVLVGLGELIDTGP